MGVRAVPPAASEDWRGLSKRVSLLGMCVKSPPRVSMLQQMRLRFGPPPGPGPPAVVQVFLGEPLCVSLAEAVGWEAVPGPFGDRAFGCGPCRCVGAVQMDSCTRDSITSHPRPHMPPLGVLVLPARITCG